MTKLKLTTLLCLIFLTGHCFAETNATVISGGNRIIVEKSKRLMHVFYNNEAIVTFHIALGRSPIGQKNCLGDNRTPEGMYTIVAHSSQSNYHKALKLSYPSASDRERARKKGCHPGGDIEIHGLQNGFGWVGRTHRSVDWTNGCIAITNKEIDILYQMVKDGTTVEIRP